MRADDPEELLAMSDVAKTLRDRRLSAWNEARALLEVSTEEDRSLSAEEEGKWSALNTEIERIDERLKAVLDSESRERATEDAYERLAAKAAVRGSGSGADLNVDVRSWAFQREGARPSIEISRPGDFNFEAVRALTTSKSVGASAGNTIPIDFYDSLIAYLIEVSGILQVGPSVLTTAGGEQVQVPVATAHILGASAVEASALPTSDPTFGQRTLSASKFAAMTSLSRELIDDTAIDLLGYLARTAGRAIGNSFGNALINGTSGVSGGVLSGAPAAVTGSVTGVNGAPSYDNLVDMEYSVIAPYRQSRSCYWLAADKTIGALRKLKDGAGRPIWEPSVVLGAPDLLLGKPIVADPFMPALGVSGVKAIAFGDFSQYFVRLVGGLRFERSDDFQFGSDQVTFRAVLRGDGNWGDVNAVKSYLTGATM